MSGLIKTRSSRVARRRILAFTILHALSLVAMTVSTTPFVRELQSGVGFAFRPVQSTVAGVAGTIGSVISSIQEMQTLRQDNRDLRAELDRLRIENVRLQEFQIENDQLLALLGAKNGSGFHTIAATVIARERPEIGSEEPVAASNSWKSTTPCSGGVNPVAMVVQRSGEARGRYVSRRAAAPFSSKALR